MFTTITHSPRTAVRVTLSDEEEYWHELAYGYVAPALDVLRATIRDIDRDVFWRTPRGKVMKAVIARHGILHAACMHQPTRSALRQAADIISDASGGGNGRRMVYRAAMTMLGQVRPEGVTVH